MRNFDEIADRRVIFVIPMQTLEKLLNIPGECFITGASFEADTNSLVLSVAGEKLPPLLPGCQAKRYVPGLKTVHIARWEIEEDVCH